MTADLKDDPRPHPSSMSRGDIHRELLAAMDTCPSCGNKCHPRHGAMPDSSRLEALERRLDEIDQSGDVVERTRYAIEYGNSDLLHQELLDEVVRLRRVVTRLSGCPASTSPDEAEQ